MKISDLQITENAYFYRGKDTLPAQVIDQVFDKVLSEKDATSTELRVVSELQAKQGFRVSCLVFGFEEPPSFLFRKSTRLLEKRFGYLLIIEFGTFVVVSRRNAPGVKQLFQYVQELDYQIVAGLYVTDGTLFEKFHMQNMDFADSAVRKRTIEATNLQESLPLLSTQRYVLRSMRLANGPERISVAMATSRLNKIGTRQGIDELCDWIQQVVTKVRAYKHTVSFLDSFPEPIDFEIEIPNCEPQSILFTLDQLVDDLERSRVGSIGYERGDNRLISIPNELFAAAVRQFEKYLKFAPDQIGGGKRKYMIPNKVDSSLCIYVNRKSIVLWAKKLKHVTLHFIDGDYDQGLLEYLNRKHQYMIAMSPANIIYYGKKLFKDSNLINNASRFMEVFVPYKVISNIVSEKGALRKNSKAFTKNSLFGFVETELSKESVGLVCDDLGDEWADFIGIGQRSVEFYHAKYHSEALSASAFHDVVSQAQKNLCRYSSTSTDWKKKGRSWRTVYKGDGVETGIQRLRIGTDVDEFVKEINAQIRKPNIDHYVYLVVNFISKKKLASEIRKMKLNPSGGRPQVTQIVWLLSSLVSICTEFNVKVRITCKP